MLTSKCAARMIYLIDRVSNSTRQFNGKMEGDRTLRMFQTNFQVVFLSMVLIILTDDNVSAISGTYFGKAIKSAATVKTIRSFAGVSIEECADECRRRAHCQYVDYLNRFKVCYIFNTTDPNEDFRRLYQNRTGSIVGVKTEWMSVCI